MKKFFPLVLVLLSISLTISCGKKSSNNNNSLLALLAGSSIFNGTSTDTDDSGDVVDSITFDSTITINFTANTAKSSGSTLDITSSGAVFTNDGGATSVTVQTGTYGVTITSTVADEVKYELTGTLSGTLTVNSSSAYELYLNTVSITGYSGGGPALDLESSAKVYIVTADGTTNTLADNSSRNSAMKQKAALFGNGAMIFSTDATASGGGTLNITGNYRDGILSSDYIRIYSGTITVSTAANSVTRDGVRSVNAFIMDDGDLTVNALGTKILSGSTVTGNGGKGIKVEGSETTGTGKGYIVINGGTINVTAFGKGITAGWDIDEDAETTSTADDPNPYVEINGGAITVTTTGTPFETSSDSISPEGIEAKSTLTINDGEITVNATEDGLNAGSSIAINGGTLYCYCPYDAIDSNGTLQINDGVIVAIGGANPEGPFDCDGRTVLINGGTLVGIGGSTSQPSATQYTVVLGGLTSGTTMALRNNSTGATEFAFTIPASYSTMVLSSPDITTGSHTVYTGATISEYDNIFNGLYYGNLTSSGGTSRKTFTISSKVSNPYNISYSFN